MKDRKQPETLRLREIMPALTVSSLEQSLGFYRDVLGLFVAEEFRQEDKLVGAALKAGSVQVLLRQDDFAQGTDRVKGVGFRLYCTTIQDIDQLAEAISHRGGKLIQEPSDQPWGARDFTIEDPDGFTLTISTGTEP